MRPAISIIYRRRRGHHASFQGWLSAQRPKAWTDSLYAEPWRHYWNSPEARQGGQGPTQVGSPWHSSNRVDGLLARGNSLSACSAPCSRTRPQGTMLAGITDMNRGQPSCQGHPATTQLRFAITAEDRGTAFVPFTGAQSTHPVIHLWRTVSNCWNIGLHMRLVCRSPPAAILRHGSVKALCCRGRPRIPRRPQLPSSGPGGLGAIFTPMANRSTAKPARPRDPLRRDRRLAWTAAPPDHCPQQCSTGQKLNSGWYRSWSAQMFSTRSSWVHAGRARATFTSRSPHMHI